MHENDEFFGTVHEDLLRKKDYDSFQRKFINIGIREGIDEGKERNLQKGFDIGYKEGAEKGYNESFINGMNSAIESIMVQLKNRKMNESDMNINFNEIKENLLKKKETGDHSR